MPLISAQERWLTRLDPARRRRWALITLDVSILAAVVNVVLYVTGIVNVDGLILVTLVLSWLALTVTFLDVVCTTDVRAESLDKSSD